MGLRMTQPNFAQMNREELRVYMLEHRDDEVAFHAYIDKLATEPVLAHGTPEDAQDPVRFAEIFARVQKLKQDHNESQS
jgi:hypothetical protein